MVSEAGAHARFFHALEEYRGDGICGGELALVELVLYGELIRLGLPPMNEKMDHERPHYLRRGQKDDEIQRRATHPPLGEQEHIFDQNLQPLHYHLPALG